MNPLAVLFQDPDSARLAAEIAGTPDPGLIRGRWDQWCARYLPSGLAEVESVVVSVGLAACWRLADGRRVFFKQLRAPAGEAARLKAVNQVLGRLRAAGFPVPEPLAGPKPCGPGLGLAQTWEEPGAFANAHRPEVRQAQAAALAELHRLTSGWTGLGDLGIKALPEGGLWPVPHSPLFDFEATAAGAETIDQEARASRVDLEGRVPRLVVSHSDWSSQHLRFHDLRLVMVYDTDSFVNVDEAYSAGLAAATFPARWEQGHEPWPSLDETEAFLDDYAVSRGPVFTAGDRRAASAYARYTRAYKDRCVHALAGR